MGANVPKAMEPLQVINSVKDSSYAVRTILAWTVNGPLNGGNYVMKTNKLTDVTANRISVARIEELWQLQFELDFLFAGQNEVIKFSRSSVYQHGVNPSNLTIDITAFAFH